MKYAIIQSGGKQYKAVEGSIIEVDLLGIDVGKKHELSEVLLIADGDKVEVGSPTVSGAKVKTTVVDHIKAKKIIVFKYHPRKRYRLKRGHRQKYTQLKIESISSKSDAKPKTAPKAAAVKEPAQTKTAAKIDKPTTTKTTVKKTAAKKNTTTKTATKTTTDKK